MIGDTGTGAGITPPAGKLSDKPSDHLSFGVKLAPSIGGIEMLQYADHQTHVKWPWRIFKVYYI